MHSAFAAFTEEDEFKSRLTQLSLNLNLQECSLLLYAAFTYFLLVQFTHTASDIAAVVSKLQLQLQLQPVK